MTLEGAACNELFQCCSRLAACPRPRTVFILCCSFASSPSRRRLTRQVKSHNKAVGNHFGSAPNKLAESAQFGAPRAPSDAHSQFARASALSSIGGALERNSLPLGAARNRKEELCQVGSILPILVLDLERPCLSPWCQMHWLQMGVATKSSGRRNVSEATN